MDATLHALANLFIESLPTVIFFAVMTVYLKGTYFVPIGRILEERRKATEGVRELAQKASDAAEGKNAEFERALHEARTEMYGEHEAQRAKWEAEHNEAMAKARAAADARLAQAKTDISSEVEAAERELESEIDALGEQIAATILRGRAA